MILKRRENIEFSIYYNVDILNCFLYGLFLRKNLTNKAWRGMISLQMQMICICGWRENDVGYYCGYLI